MQNVLGDLAIGAYGALPRNGNHGFVLVGEVLGETNDALIPTAETTIGETIEAGGYNPGLFASSLHEPIPTPQTSSSVSDLKQEAKGAQNNSEDVNDCSELPALLSDDEDDDDSSNSFSHR